MRRFTPLAIALVAPFSLFAKKKNVSSGLEAIAVITPKENITKIVDSKKSLHLLHGQKVKKLDDNTDNNVVFIGSSRILYDIQLDIWKEKHCCKITNVAMGSCFCKAMS